MKYRCCEMTAPEKNYQTSLAHIQTVIRGYLLGHNKTILRHIKYGRQSSRAAPYQHSSWLRHWTSSPKGLPEPPPRVLGPPQLTRACCWLSPCRRSSPRTRGLQKGCPVLSRCIKGCPAQNESSKKCCAHLSTETGSP